MWLKVKVLLWKSLQLRKRHWFYTILEIIVPCLLFGLLGFSKAWMNTSKTKVNESIPTPHSENTLYEEFIFSNSSGYFIYSPKTPESDKVMKYVAKNLNIPFNIIDTANDEGEMVQKIKNKSNDTEDFEGFGIFFEEIKTPLVFKYKIRSTNKLWNTNLLFPSIENPGYMSSGNNYISKGFLALQLMLDKSFIILGMSSKSNTSINSYNLKIQQYPYGKFTKDSELESFFKDAYPFIVISFSLMCLQTIKRIAEENDSGIKELMKMMGLKSWMMWTGWILHNFFAYVISITVITYISCFGIYSDKEKLLNHTNPSIFWIFLTMYMITANFFCFAICSVFRRPLIGLFVGMTVWIGSYSVSDFFLKSNSSIFVHILFMLFPNHALEKGLKAISALESLGVGLKFSTLLNDGKNNASFSVGFVLFMFVVDCFSYGLITWYLDSVMPGKFGIAKPLNFWCLWSRKKPENNIALPVRKTNKFFEKPPNDFEVGISIKNLNKKFGSFNAVNGVNLDLYKGQITALLGHNGAGKTTTMSIITGI